MDLNELVNWLIFEVPFMVNSRVVLLGVAIVLVFLLRARPLPERHRVGKRYYEAGGRRFFITGAASGLGNGLVSRLLARGHLVAAADINEEALVRHAETSWARYKDQLKIIKLDVSKAQDWEAAMKDIAASKGWGGLDVLMNVAGYLKPGMIQTIEPKEIDLHVGVNMKGVIFGTHFGSRFMLENLPEKGAHIINIASLGAIAPVSGVGLYIGTKYGCRGFTLCAAKDLAPHGVYLTVVMPDAIQTPMVDLQLNYVESAWAFSGDRILTVEEVANVILDDVLPNRPRQTIIGTSFVRGSFARLSDIWHSSQLIYWIENNMLSKGVMKQQAIRNQ